MSKRAYDPISRPSKGRPSKGAAPRTAPRGPKRTPDHGGMTGMLLDLQRTVGNQAVVQLLQRQAAHSNHAATPSPAREHHDQRPQQHAGAGGAQPTIQRLMSFDEFKKASGQTASSGRRGLRGPSAAKRAAAESAAESWTDIVSGKTGQEALVADRTKRGLGSGGGAYIDINNAYEAYEGNQSLTNLIALYDRITYWETINAGYKWADDLKPVLAKVKQQIEADVQAETAKQAGGDAKKAPGGMLGKAKSAAGGLLGKGARTARTGAAAMKPLLKDYPSFDAPGKSDLAAAILASAATMPPFLQEVGVSQGYYDDYLKGHPEHIKSLEAFYLGLKEGRLTEASRAYAKVSHLEGMYLIKPLFLSHFAGQVNLQGIVGTDAKATEGMPVSKEEEQAILKYTSEDYKKMNAQLRGHNLRSAGRRGPSTHRESLLAAKMQTAVTGLNKFPKFQGIAYRVSINVPPGYFAAVRPGGIMADLAFNSASPSMSGVGAFSKTYGEGSKSLYYIIHTKTAVNIVGFSAATTEGEILFRPGTRFLVKAVWEHVDGKVPPNAPPQAQMVLHSMGEYKDAKGAMMFDYSDNDFFDLLAEREKANPDVDRIELGKAVKRELFAKKAQEGTATKVKVIEMAEV